MNRAYKSAFNSAFKKASKLIKNPGKISSLLMASAKKININKSSLKNIKAEILLFIDLVKHWAKGDYKDVSSTTIITVIASLLYFVNPLDLIPDFTPILGFTDDATILLYVISKISTELDQFRNWKDLQTVNTIDVDGKVIE